MLWVDGADTDGPWNYVVKEVSRWKNSTQYAIQKVTVSDYKKVQDKIKAAMEFKENLESDESESNTDAKNPSEPV